VTESGMALTPSWRMGPPPRNLAVDAYGSIMVRSAPETPEYKSVDAMFRAHWQVPLGSFWET
jgi:hypothetical protein